MAIYIVNIQVSFYQYKKRIDDGIKTARNDVNILRKILSDDYDTEVAIHHYINDKTTVVIFTIDSNFIFVLLI